jgi:hypothetical protein
MCAESLQEYYGESYSDDILNYVHINANVLNEIFTKNVSKCVRLTMKILSHIYFILFIR